MHYNLKSICLTLLIASFNVIISQVTLEESSIPTDFYQQLEWRNIGPYRGGRSLGAAGSPGRTNEYYFGATGGGLWKTVDGGLIYDPNL